MRLFTGSKRQEDGVSFSKVLLSLGSYIKLFSLLCSFGVCSWLMS